MKLKRIYKSMLSGCVFGLLIAQLYLFLNPTLYYSTASISIPADSRLDPKQMVEMISFDPYFSSHISDFCNIDNIASVERIADNIYFYRNHYENLYEIAFSSNNKHASAKCLSVLLKAIAIDHNNLLQNVDASDSRVKILKPVKVFALPDAIPTFLGGGLGGIIMGGLISFIFANPKRK